MKTRLLSLLRFLAPALLLALGLAIGLSLNGEAPAESGGLEGPPPAQAGHGHNHGQPARAPEPEPEPEALWTCSMHPQVRLPKDQPCPICGMDLIPVGDSGSDGDSDAPTIRLTPRAAALARLEVVTVENRAVTQELRLVGQIAWDETRVARITAWFGGRIERLFVDTPGVWVTEKDHLFEIYSPELLAAQQELLQAHRTLSRLKSTSSEGLRGAAQATADAVEERLRLWGLKRWQIKRVLKRKKPLKRVTVYAPISGIVTNLAATEGGYVNTGASLFTIADPAHIWVNLSVPERDLSSVRYGQSVRLTVDALGGRTLEGTVAFVSPTVDPKTRTAIARVNISNKDGQLRPGSFVRATIKIPIGSHGASTAADALAGHWVSPMHPEVIKDGPGTCDICGMDLVPAEEHWLTRDLFQAGDEDAGAGAATDANADSGTPLVVPTTAVLTTGRRAIVFVEDPEADAPTYALREVELGPEAGRWTVIQSGLTAGERVVAAGAFKLDSTLQIRGEHSLMSPESDAEKDAENAETADPDFPTNDDAIAALTRAVTAVQGLATALAGDDMTAAKVAIADLDGELKDLKTRLRELPDAEMGAEMVARMDHASAAGSEAPSTVDGLPQLRAALRDLNAVLIPLVRSAGDAFVHPFALVHCPMAFDDAGADWLQAPGDVANPYFGASMLRCGEITQESAAAPEAPNLHEGHEGHEGHRGGAK